MKNIKKSLLLATLGGVMAVGLASCGKEEKNPTLELSTEYVGTEVQRHQTIQFTVAKTDVEGDVVYSVSEAATASISAEGCLTVSDTAAVGAEFTVSASIGEVKSNELKFKVVDTPATSMNLVPSSRSIKEDNEISFGATYNPTYASLTAFTIEAVGENAGLVEINNNVLKLKDGVDFEQNYQKQVTVRATLTSNTAITSEVKLMLGEVVSSLNVKEVKMVVSQEPEYTVVPELYDQEGNLCDPSLDYEFVSNNTDVFTVDQDGKITPKAHGEGTLTVKYGTEEETAPVKIILAPTSIEFLGATPAMKTKGMSFSKANDEKFPIQIKTTLDPKYTSCSEKYVFEIENKTTGNKGDQVAVIDQENKISFKEEGEVVVTVRSDSSMEGVQVLDEWETSTSMTFNVNNGVNVHNLAELQAELEREPIAEQDEDPVRISKVINLINNIDVTSENVKRDGEGSYESIFARGDITIYGNGHDIDLTNLPLDPRQNSGTEFIKFYPQTDFAHEAYSVKLNDFGLYAPNDYNGYITRVDNPFDYISNNGVWCFGGTGTPEFNRMYRTGLCVGYNNEMENFIDDDGENLYQTQEFYNAYIKDFEMNDITIRGFYWGIWASHVIGEINNLDISDCVEKGILNCQSQFILRNAKFGQFGGFATEISLDGINDIKHAGPNRHPTAGPGYNEKPYIHMEGSRTECKNFNSGADTLYMYLFNLDLAAKPQAQALGIRSANELAEWTFNTAVKDRVPSYNTEAIERLKGIVESMAYKPGTTQLNYFNLAFMFDLELSGKNGQTADLFSDFGENLAGASIGRLENILDNLVKTSGGDQSYKNYKFISMDVKVPSMYVGKIVLANMAYEGK